MPTTLEKTSTTRQEFTKLKFYHQVNKALRKGKLAEIIIKDAEQYGFDNTSIIVDPAFLHMRYDHRELGDVYSFMTDNNHPLIMIGRQHELNKYIIEERYLNDQVVSYYKSCSVDHVYDLLIESDPTENKEYAQWILTMYTRILKDRQPAFSFNNEENLIGGFAYLFFEDLGKLTDAILIFHKIKNTKLVENGKKDIYTYKSINHFISTVFSINIGDTDGQKLEDGVLSSDEILSLNTDEASIIYRDTDWIVVHTATREANVVFGKNTTWCTALSRYGSSMFDSYNKQGKLFVLIKNQQGVNQHIKSNPNARLQFHFESNQFMNAMDKSIDITKFLSENGGVKDFFKAYIIERVLPKKTKTEDIIALLRKFSMIKELIPILKGMKIQKLDLSNIISNDNVIELDQIGELDTLEELIIRDAGISNIPVYIKNLTNLRELRLGGNKIREIPNWLNELKSLEVLSLIKNLIDKPFDVSGLVNLQEINLGLNKNLQVLPTGLSKLPFLQTIECTLSDIRAVDDEILACEGLVQINLSGNKNLKDIPEEIINLPNLLYIGLDATGIPLRKINRMDEIKINRQTVIE